MELGIFERQLKLMVLLTQNREYTIEQLCDRLNMSRRTIYRYLELFRDIGFVVEKQGNVYRLDKSSPFFNDITQLVHFTEDEALTLRHVLDQMDNTDFQVKHLRAKLDRIYDFGILNAIETNEQRGMNLRVLYEAMKQHQQVILHDYSSPHSNKTGNRVVEPYAFLNNHNDIRCYELDSQQNKTFKVSRIGQVEVLPLLWEHDDEHAQVFTDVFQFSGENPIEVTLRIGRLACNLLKEEYPRATHCLAPDGEDCWILRVKVCSFQGIGRFVMGLFHDIEVLSPASFIDFLRERTSLLTKKLH